MDDERVHLITLETTDNILLDALFYEPHRKPEKNRYGVVIVHGMGLNFYSSVSKYLPPYLVEKDYFCLSMNTRGHDIVSISRSFKDKYGSAWELLNDSVYDIDAAMAFLKEKNIEKVVLVGHSLGALKISIYASKSTNVLLKGIIICSPARSMKLLLTLWTGANYEEIYNRAKHLVEESKGDILVTVSRNWPYILSARTCLQYLEDEDNTNLFKILPKVKCPTLFVLTKDESRHQNDLMSAVSKDFPCTTTVIENADHFFSTCQDELGAAIVSWLEHTIFYERP